MSEWISVKDRLPYKAGRYLVHVENTANYHRLPDDIVIAVWVIKEWGFDGMEYNRVTHWMPFPKMPESEDDAENSCMKEASEGEWIVHYNDIFPVESTEECSICHAEQYINCNDDNYCPNCGAKMKQVGKG